MKPDRAQFNRIMDQVAEDFRDQADIRAKCKTDDEALVHLANHEAQIGRQCLLHVYDATPAKREEADFWLADQLRCVAAFAFAWLAPKSPLELMEAIFKERQFQERQFREGKFSFTCASPVADVRRKFRVLKEECGEVAQAVDRIEECPSRHQLPMLKHELEKELIQVAAVCVAWLESLEQKQTEETKI